MAADRKSILFPVFSQLYDEVDSVPRDNPAQANSEADTVTEEIEEGDDTSWQDFLTYGREVRS